MSYINRLRAAFAVVVIAALGAAVVGVVVFTRDAQREAVFDATEAEVDAAAQGAQRQLAEALEREQENAGEGRLRDLIARQVTLLGLRGIDLVRISGGEAQPLLPADEAPPNPTPATNVGVAELLARGLTTTDAVSWTDAGRVVAATPIPFTDAEIDELRLGDDLVVVVGDGDLGRAGLGPVGLPLAVSAAAALLVALALAEVLARRIRDPLRSLADASAAIARGDLSARVDLAEGSDPAMAELGATIDGLAAGLADASRQRQNFLADVSHELATPLSSVIGYAELLASGQLTGRAEVEAAGGVMLGEGRRMDRLVQDLLSLATLDSGDMRIRPEQVDLVQLGRETAEAFVPRMQEVGKQLSVEGATHPIWVHVDPQRLGQVIANLIANAADFAAENVLVDIASVDGRGVLRVIDDGPGLGPAADHIFERRFSGVRSDRHGRSGRGLGLAIVGSFVEAMGGDITAADEPAGTVFALSFVTPSQ